VKSKPVDRSAGFGFLMVPEMGLEPVRMVSPTVFKTKQRKGRQRPGLDRDHSHA